MRVGKKGGRERGREGGRGKGRREGGKGGGNQEREKEEGKEYSYYMIWLLDQSLLPFRQGCLEKENDNQLWMAPECRALLKAVHLAQSFPKKKANRAL